MATGGVPHPSYSISGNSCHYRALSRDTKPLAGLVQDGQSLALATKQPQPAPVEGYRYLLNRAAPTSSSRRSQRTRKRKAGGTEGRCHEEGLPAVNNLRHYVLLRGSRVCQRLGERLMSGLCNTMMCCVLVAVLFKFSFVLLHVC